MFKSKKSFLLAVIFTLVFISLMIISGEKPVRAQSTTPIWSCTKDPDGVETPTDKDQKDLTKMCTDVNPVNSTTFGIKWQWDDVQPGVSQAYFACALFDDGTDGLIDYAVCVQATPNATTGFLEFTAEAIFRCDGPNKKSDRCVGQVPVTGYTGCTVDNVGVDPFGGFQSPNDTTASCVGIPYSVIGGTATVLRNVCSFTSFEQSGSNPFDSEVLLDSEDLAFLSITKMTDKPVDEDFVFLTTTTGTVPPGATLPYTFPKTDNLKGNNTESSSTRFLIPSGTSNVTETAMIGWDLISSTCYRVSAPTVPLSPDSFTIAPNDDIYCTFTNQAKVDLTVDKTDHDSLPDGGSNLPIYAIAGGTIGYTITITNKAMTVNYTAFGVVVTDTLDVNLTVGDSDASTDGIQVANTVTREGSPVTPVDCLWTAGPVGTGGTVTCNLGTMAIQEVATIEFTTTVGLNTPNSSAIETGTCTQSPNLQGSTAVDVCNIVSVSGSDEALGLQGDNSDSDPRNIVVPTAVKLINFTATADGSFIQLDWETASEIDNLGFNLYRTTNIEGINKLKLNHSLIPSYSPGNPTGSPYIFTDSFNLNSRTVYYYWLEDLDTNGTLTLHGPVFARLADDIESPIEPPHSIKIFLPTISG